MEMTHMSIERERAPTRSADRYKVATTKTLEHPRAVDNWCEKWEEGGPIYTHLYNMHEYMVVPDCTAERNTPNDSKGKAYSNIAREEL